MIFKKFTTIVSGILTPKLAFLFIKGAEALYLKKLNYKVTIFYFVVSLFGRVEYSFFNTYFLIGFFLFLLLFYFIFFTLVFKNERFASFTCTFLKKNLEKKVFDSLVGNLPYHEFIAQLGGASMKLLAKYSAGHLVLAAGGFVMADHAYSELGLKTVVDTKAYLISEEMKRQFALKHGLTYTPGLSPQATRSLLQTYIENNPRP